MTRHRTLPAVFAVLGVLLLAGCSTGPAPAAPDTPVVVSAATGPAPSTPERSPARSSTPAALAGCTADGTRRPADATTAGIGDVDGDGRSDSIFFSSGGSRFGISTASGAVLPVVDRLPGPGRHTGWAARVAGGAVVLVLADGRGARLYSLQRTGSGCVLGAVRNPRGDPVEFDQEELRGTGTGVGCRLQDGAVQLGGYDAHATAGDPPRFRVTFTRVVVSADGRTAADGPTTVVAGSAAGTNDVVRLAQMSTCGSAPVVGSTGQ